MLVQEPEHVAGENVAVTPDGSPEAEKVGLALPVAVAVILVVADPPSTMEIELGVADRLMLLAGALA